VGARVTIVDYGSGNLFSVTRALEHCGASVTAAHDAAAIDEAERLLLPGVGAFAEGMRGLRERGLDEAIRRYAISGRPLLGICLGMQMLATVSEEFGEHQGLDLIPGRVRPVLATDIEGRPHKIPHIGWSALRAPTGADWHDSILEDTEPGSAVYMVHSFAVVPDDRAHRLAECYYGGHAITAAIRRGTISGCQFHPEKSGKIGLAILARFLRS
jgi:imidazole glycerol-phosphate synthase subunit HisH